MLSICPLRSFDRWRESWNRGAVPAEGCGYPVCTHICTHQMKIHMNTQYTHAHIHSCTDGPHVSALGFLLSRLVRLSDASQAKKTHTDIQRKISYKGLTHRITEAPKSCDLLCRCWPSRARGGKSSPAVGTVAQTNIATPRQWGNEGRRISSLRPVWVHESLSQKAN